MHYFVIWDWLFYRKSGELTTSPQAEHGTRRLLKNMNLMKIRFFSNNIKIIKLKAFYYFLYDTVEQYCYT